MWTTRTDIGHFHDARSLVESRSTPLGGALIVTVALFVVALVAWMGWARVDEVVRAAGRVEPVGRVKIINHPRGGRVAEIMVAEGDRVRAGQPLLRLDPEVKADSYAELVGRYQVKAVEVARLEAEAAGRSAPVVDPAVARVRPDLVSAAHGLMQARAQAYAARHEALDRAAQARGSEARTAAAELGRVRNSLVLLRQQLAAVTQLAERGLYPKLKLVAMKRQVSDAEGEVEKTKASLAAARAAAAEATSRLASLEKDWRSRILSDLGTSRAELDRLREQLDGQKALLDGLVVRAPVAGIVQELAVAAPGQSVSANEPLMKLVPTDKGVLVEARVANADIGKVRVGMPAAVKVLAYNFVRHGKLEGKVVKIAADASAVPHGGPPTYAVTVVTGRDYLGRPGSALEIVPGMVVDVEVHTGERTILSYITDRLWRTGDEAFREG